MSRIFFNRPVAKHTGNFPENTDSGENVEGHFGNVLQIIILITVFCVLTFFFYIKPESAKVANAKISNGIGGGSISGDCVAGNKNSQSIVSKQITRKLRCLLMPHGELMTQLKSLIYLINTTLKLHFS